MRDLQPYEHLSARKPRLVATRTLYKSMKLDDHLAGPRPQTTAFASSSCWRSWVRRRSGQPKQRASRPTSRVPRRPPAGFNAHSAWMVSAHAPQRGGAQDAVYQTSARVSRWQRARSAG